MTYIYQWFSFPEVFSVVCPKCSKECSCSEIPIIKNANGIKTEIKSGKLSDNFQAQLNCTNCGYNKEKTINWIKDAFWKFDIKGEILWAWDLEHSKAILEYVMSKQREQIKDKYTFSFLHIPKFFKLAKNRDLVVKKITKRINLNETK